MKYLRDLWFPRDEPGISELNTIGATAVIIAMALVLASRRFPADTILQSSIGAFYILQFILAWYAGDRRKKKVARILAEGDYPDAAQYYMSKLVWYHAPPKRSIPYLFGTACFLAGLLFCAIRSY